MERKVHISKISIRNYKLLINTELEVDHKTTLIVGRNNTAKTSLVECIARFLSGRSLLFNDYPLSKRKDLIKEIGEYRKGNILFEELRERIEPVSIEFTVDYKAENMDDDLGALSPFIIDMDTNTTIAKIKAEYRLTPDEKAFNRNFANNHQEFSDDEYRNVIADAFDKLFELKIYAINPVNDQKQTKKLQELQDLFPFYSIPAERTLGEDERHRDSLVDLISDFFEMKEEDMDEEFFNDFRELRSKISKANSDIQKQCKKILSSLVQRTLAFGYPNAEELQWGVMTKLDIDEQIKNKSVLSYNSKNDESLPSSHNGLGYKNLIKIVFLLASFAKEWEKKKDEVCIPLLFIEEPESHMHPQMQKTFALYLEKFLEGITDSHIQVLLTSHSAQIVNAMDFSQVRYAHKKAKGVEYKNLSSFASTHKEHLEFIKKYLTLTRCDLFFADKIILVEGASERLLIPHMIEKCDRENLFGSGEYRLPYQYYTLVEVGGAYAYKFIPFVEFLEVPTLIITDIDSVSPKGGKLASCFVSEATTTSNQTIKWWLQKSNKPTDVDGGITIEDVKSLSNSSKDKTRKNCHIEFQTCENGICGRSLEEAIQNVNRSLYNLPEELEEKDLTFKGKKTDFALHLIESEDYVIPQYIKSGLQWLNKQSVQ